MSPKKRYAKKHANANSAVAYKLMHALSAPSAKRNGQQRPSIRP
jgi:hypothetical protein